MPVYPFSIVVCYIFRAEKKKPSSQHTHTHCVCAERKWTKQKCMMWKKSLNKIGTALATTYMVRTCVCVFVCLYRTYSVRRTYQNDTAYEKCVGDCELGWITLNSWHMYVHGYLNWKICHRTLVLYTAYIGLTPAHKAEESKTDTYRLSLIHEYAHKHTSHIAYLLTFVFWLRVYACSRQGYNSSNA